MADLEDILRTEPLVVTALSALTFVANDHEQHLRLCEAHGGLQHQPKGAACGRDEDADGNQGERQLYTASIAEDGETISVEEGCD